MKKISIILFLICIFYVGVKSESSVSSTFDQANQLYAEQNYTEAIKIYEDIIMQNGFSPELYYNLGNAYFKTNELAKAILNYERALRISPRYADAKFNLKYANERVIDRIDVKDTFFLKTWFHELMQSQTSNAWFCFAVIFFTITLISILIFVFGKTKLIRKIAFYMALISLLFSLSSISFSGIRKAWMKDRSDGIIMSGAVVVKGAPDRSGTDLFQLHEGTKVDVISTLGEWYEIRIGNGNVGWIEIKHVEKI